MIWRLDPTAASRFELSARGLALLELHHESVGGAGKLGQSDRSAL